MAAPRVKKTAEGHSERDQDESVKTFGDYTGMADGEVLAGYEYLDHTADVQLHSYGRTLEESFEMVVQAMFGYMTDLNTVEKKETQTIEAEGHDLLSLLFHLLDEFLFVFSAEPYFIAKEIKILEFDRENFTIIAEGYGETFDLNKHPQGTEVKAITYSNMQVHHELPTNDCYVIIDI